ncbi:CsbD family protein [Streptomyces sp. WAC06614]|uniref:CsbD family protein n=1 Tax=Streptomyces sp. WAC06614 TaxID=2487416 RepID=UPI000F7837AF|nr:CsbD family protein [Streptomyces sp. WAC06614]RSS70327.1 CsbD family protein [Streptomyces sp. WAC06614]
MGKIKGKADKITGKTKEELGSATGDKSMEMKGKAKKVKGHAEDTASDAAAKMRRMADKDH